MSKIVSVAGGSDEVSFVVSGALNEALAQQVCKLFGVLVAAPADDVEAMARFLRGLDKALALHAEVTAEVEAPLDPPSN